MAQKLAVIFGGGGFIGRYVAGALLGAGWRVRVASRDPASAYFLKPLGALGQTQFVAADITRPATLAPALAGADAAINLVGILRGDFARVHVAGAGNVARAAADAGVRALAHLSAIGADAESASAYGRSKAGGEAAVRAAFPAAAILRPSVVFGREDGFVNRFAGMIRALPVLPVLKPDARFQPVHVGDVAQAIVASLAPAVAGQTLALGGPEVVTMIGLHRWIAAQIGRTPVLLPLPDPVAGAFASIAGLMPGAPITRDQWAMLQRDNVVGAEPDGLRLLGIAPTPLAAVAEGWLVRYRRHGRFAGRAAA